MVLRKRNEAAGLLSFTLIIFTTVHDWGYFSVIGANFRTLLSPYDYITNAIEWMPSFSAVFVGTLFLGYVNSEVWALWGRTTLATPTDGFGDHRRKRFRGVMLKGSLWFLLFALLPVVAVFFTTGLWSRQTLISAGPMFATARLAAFSASRQQIGPIHDSI
jgi:hypothetical protein